MHDFIPIVCISYVHICVVFILWTHHCVSRLTYLHRDDLCTINLHD